LYHAVLHVASAVASHTSSFLLLLNNYVVIDELFVSVQECDATKAKFIFDCLEHKILFEYTLI